MHAGLLSYNFIEMHWKWTFHGQIILSKNSFFYHSIENFLSKSNDAEIFSSKISLLDQWVFDMHVSDFPHFAWILQTLTLKLEYQFKLKIEHFSDWLINGFIVPYHNVQVFLQCKKCSVFLKFQFKQKCLRDMQDKQTDIQRRIIIFAIKMVWWLCINMIRTDIQA